MAQPTESPPGQSIIERYIIVFDQICAEEKKTAYNIAATLNISSAMISQFRSGKLKTIQAEYIKNICLTYDYSLIWVMTGEGDMKAGNETLSMQQDIAKMKKDIAKILELQKDVVGPLINEILGIKVGPSDVKGKLINEVKKRAKLSS